MKKLFLFSLFLSLGYIKHSSCSLSLDPKDFDPLVQEWLENMQNEGVKTPKIQNSTNNAAPTMPLANIKNGTVAGSLSATVSGQDIYQYLGVPYAKAPVGPLRFQPPQPYEGWGSGMFYATSHPHSCPQYLTNFTIASEDCLFLSIYSRRPPSGSGGVGIGPPLPVVVFIHGGSFVSGQNSYYDPYKILEERVVLVTIQYRLGSLGFFYTGDDTVSGNNGLKDMVQGLRWIQENIVDFGGDPNAVTVMGEYAPYMLISPLAQGLFHRVIGMSGTPIMESGIDRQPARSAERLAKMVNCSRESSQEIVDCMMTLDAQALAKAELFLVLEDLTNFTIALHGASPVVEGNVPGAFLPDDPVKLLREGPIPDVPIVIGSVQHEGSLAMATVDYLVLGPSGLLNDTKYVREDLVANVLSNWGIDEKMNGGSVSQSMAAGYFKPGADRGNYTQIQYELLDMVTSLFMKAPLLRTADILAERGKDVYLYNFEKYHDYGNSIYDLTFNVLDLIIGGKRPQTKHGICHGDDLMYMFQLPFLFSANDTKFSRTYVSLFTNFIVTGNPTPEATEDYPIWPKYDLEGQNYMRLDLPFQVKQDFTSNWRLGMKGEDGWVKP